jgi:hypothetical protein
LIFIRVGSIDSILPGMDPDEFGPKVFDVKLAHIVPDQLQLVAMKKWRVVFEFREATTLYSSCVAAMAEFAGGILGRTARALKSLNLCLTTYEST